MSLAQKTHDLVEVLDAVVGSYREAAAEKGVRLTLENKLKSHVAFLFDKYNLTEALRRLISNAIKFTQGGTVTVSVEHDGPENVLINVADTGVGIDADHQIVLFEEFEGHDPRTARRGGGSGLSMNIVRRRVELMGGSVAVSSQRGEGTVFKIRLPLGSMVKREPSASMT